MNKKFPTLTLNNGVKIPAIGLGVLGRENPELVAPSVEAAIRTGYRLIDTAAAYGNERPVAEGIAASGVDRSEIFITTKLWLTQYGYESALRGFEASLRRLGTDYVDLYLLHWPMPTNFEATVAAYRAAERLLADGRVRAIGVSNFSPAHLKNLMDRAKVVPAVNQVELHPFFAQRELRDAHAQLGIITEAWSPLGGSVRRKGGESETGDPLAHPTIVAIAAKHGKTTSQTILRWHVQHGLCAIPKSFRKERIAENFDIFDFVLTSDDMAALDALDTGVRSGPDPEVVCATTFPIKVED
jgi:diketogulonate reductase-like aldo/keto reductase